MKIKHTDIIIKEDDPFANCKLERKVNAHILTNVVSTYADGFVLAINNEWGTGKTTFVKMWQHYLKNNGFNTIYFNAWENDFDNNPLVAIISELETLTNFKNKNTFKSVLAKAAVISKNMLPTIIKAIAERYIKTEIVLDSLENATKGTTEILKEEIKEYSNKKQTVKEFKDALEVYIEDISDTKPIIFIIDELDRCRPNYAVEVLEQMKHLFTVSGIVFVLSIDKTQLSHAVKGVYGSEHINSEEYLRRFIDLEYSLPPPNIKKICNYLYDYYNYGSFFSSKDRMQFSELRDDKDSLLNMAEILLKRMNATLRQQEKIFAHTRLVLNSFKSTNYVFPQLLFLLIYLKFDKSDLFDKIKNNTLSLQELNDEFEGVFLDENLHEFHELNLTYVEALLLQFYNNERNNYGNNELYSRNDIGVYEVNISTKIIDKKYLMDCIESIARSFRYNDTKISYLINKINLFEAFIINK